MKISSKSNVADQLRFWGSRILIGGVAVVVYFMIWRPVRVFVTEQVVYPQVEYFESGQAKFESGLKTGALFIFYDYGEGAKQLEYRPEFGFFFLVALLTLLFVADRKKPYLILLYLHLGGSMLSYLFLMAGAMGFQPGFILTDAVSGYLVPALTLGLVPLEMKGFGE